MQADLTIPRATYRLQFHCGFTLRDALGLIPYLHALGVSHVYASPLLKARPGSTHGYDVCDPRQMNPEIGTEADLAAFVAALRQCAMGLVLDIVPNHAAAAPENPWWWDVLKNGRDSHFADYFDIDWNPPDPRLGGKVLLPILGDELDRVLERGQLKVVCENAEVEVRYFNQRFPVSPESILVPAKFLPEALAEFNADREALTQFLDQQHYRLAFWRQGDSQLNYRRFFTITHLAGMRVELPQVFTDTHNLIIDWRQRGLLDGLRVDHPDGLSDPQDYLRRLSAAAPGAWIVVEKILEPGEDLPPDWPVAGTTGYDFLNRVAGLFIDPTGEKPLTDFYAAFTGEPTDYAVLVREKKRWILRHHLVAEVTRLARLLQSLAAGDNRGASFTTDQLREALVELVACFPVYRTYVRADLPRSADSQPAVPRVSNRLASGEVTDDCQPMLPSAPIVFLREQDLAVVAEAIAASQRERPDLALILGYLGDLLVLRAQAGESAEFVMRFQQLTGPAMAKGVEDTTYYCFNRFVALNEVGGDPSRLKGSVNEFHRACGEAQQRWPNAMLATSTHDTKRGEDVRARMALLSEIPERWITAVRRWSAINEKHRRNGWPDRNAEYLFYQTLVGAWPLSLDRAWAYMEKAAREAKQHTNWGDPHAAYEAALKHFVTATLNDREFAAEIERFVTPLVGAGYVNSLAQTLLKLTTPGVPDIYQGADLWDFSLVDPDNRRPVDFAPRQEALLELQRHLQAGAGPELINDLLRVPANGHIKLLIIHQALQYRRQHAHLFRNGGYVPLQTTGAHAEHVCAFARRLGAATAITVVPRLALGLVSGRNCAPVGGEIWEHTRLVLPRAQAGRSFRNVFTGEVLRAREEEDNASLRLAEVLGQLPVALLERLYKPAETKAATIQSP